ncbi:MAG: hypothetical protein WDW36_001408 [Sanguina aurantia]
MDEVRLDSGSAGAPLLSRTPAQEDSKSQRLGGGGGGRKGAAAATAEDEDDDDDDEEGDAEQSDKVADVIAMHAPASPAFARMAKLLKQQASAKGTQGTHRAPWPAHQLRTHTLHSVALLQRCPARCHVLGVASVSRATSVSPGPNAPQAGTLARARSLLLEVEAELRKVDTVCGGHTACADVLHLYAATATWFTAEDGYKAFSSSPVHLHDDLLKLHKAAPGADAAAAGGGAAAAAAIKHEEGGGAEEEESGSGNERAEGDPATTGRRRVRKVAFKLLEMSSAEAAAAKLERRDLSKRYSHWFVWGQLSGWFKQSVNDPAQSLSAERKGTLSLPDIESCYRGGHPSAYGGKLRSSLLQHIEESPDAMWRSDTMFTYRNDNKVYGSPMFDDEYAAACATAAHVPPPQSHIQPHTYSPVAPPAPQHHTQLQLQLQQQAVQPAQQPAQQQQQQPQQQDPSAEATAAPSAASADDALVETPRAEQPAPVSVMRAHTAGPAVAAVLQHLRSVAVPWGSEGAAAGGSGLQGKQSEGDHSGGGAGMTGPVGGSKKRAGAGVSAGGRGGGGGRDGGGAQKRKAGRGGKREASEEWDSSE